MRTLALCCVSVALVMAADAPLDTLRQSHPRLVALDNDIIRVRKLIQADSTAAELHGKLRQEAERLLVAPPVEYVKIGPRLLAESRRCLDRVYTLALLYRLDPDRRYLERVKKELFAAAAFPDWNP
ncbi:MAG: hypothetical protein HY238_27960 [Acidobacteria bacterium]|nr:hypothetical protein [Acidobacteriota bacterium]